MKDHAHGRNWFCFGCAFELLLGALAVGLAPILHVPPLADFHWGWEDAVWGLLGTAPLLGVLAWMLQTSAAPIRAVRHFLEICVRPILGQWSMLQLATISALAGLCEELLFRVVQNGVGRSLGMTAGLLVSCILFGCFHYVNRPYAVVAGLIGAYLGLLWIWTGNLLVPMLAHATYDFVALVYFLRLHKPGSA